jgi:hypothetical protein
MPPRLVAVIVLAVVTMVLAIAAAVVRSRLHDLLSFLLPLASSASLV